MCEECRNNGGITGNHKTSTALSGVVLFWKRPPRPKATDRASMGY